MNPLITVGLVAVGAAVVGGSIYFGLKARKAKEAGQDVTPKAAATWLGTKSQSCRAWLTTQKESARDWIAAHWLTETGVEVAGRIHIGIVIGALVSIALATVAYGWSVIPSAYVVLAVSPVIWLALNHCPVRETELVTA